jgi:hypothetical protein
MRLGGTFPPSPSPTYSNDPFAPDVTIWPDAPDWLFPLVMVLVAIVALVIAVLIVLWRRSILIERREREAKGPTQWVDLSKLDKKGRWEDDGPPLDPPEQT